MGHVSNYYLGQPITDEEVAALQAAAEAINIDVIDTRYVSISFTWILMQSQSSLFNRLRKNGPNDFTLLVASADPQPQAQHSIKVKGADAKLTVEYGDFSDALQKAVAALKEVMTCNLERSVAV